MLLFVSVYTQRPTGLPHFQPAVNLQTGVGQELC